jgi:hypothetical protein
MYLALLPFRLQPPVQPQDRFRTLPLSFLGLLLAEVWASPFPRRLSGIDIVLL